MCRLPAAGTVSTHTPPRTHTHPHHTGSLVTLSRFGGRVVCQKQCRQKPRQAANLDGADKRRQAGCVGAVAGLREGRFGQRGMSG